MAAGLSRSADPNGNPQSARTCCSNWLVTAASIVRCPELWGRGAISFTSKRPSDVRKNSTVSTPTVSSRLGGGQRQAARLLCDNRAQRRGHQG